MIQENTPDWKYLTSLLIKEKPIRVKGLKHRKDNEKYEILCIDNPTMNCIDYLNNTAAEILELCDGSNSIESIIEELYRRYKIDKHRLTLNTIKCIRSLEGRGLLYKRKYGHYPIAI